MLRMTPIILSMVAMAAFLAAKPVQGQDNSQQVWNYLANQVGTHPAHAVYGAPLKKDRPQNMGYSQMNMARFGKRKTPVGYSQRMMARFGKRRVAQGYSQMNMARFGKRQIQQGYSQRMMARFGKRKTPLNKDLVLKL